MTSSKVKNITVSPDFEGQRIDNFLLRELKGVPKTAIYRILRKGEVRVNKGRVKPTYKLQGGDVVRIPPIRTAEASVKHIDDSFAAALSERILFEDENILLFDKPHGLAVHGGSGVSTGVIELLRHHRQDLRYLELVHRLDRETSGALLLAKKRSRLREIHELIRENRMEKFYQAIVVGHWPAKRDVVNAPLRKFQKQGGERMVKVQDDGKPSRTFFKILKAKPSATLLEARLETGRTHQIRVHCQFAGHPVLGDDRYGDDKLNTQLLSDEVRRLYLHSCFIGFTLPSSGKRYELACSVPECFGQFINRAS